MVKPASFDSKGMKKGAWSEDEDNKLRDYVLRYGHWNWRLLPKYAGLARCGKSCRLRWMNHLKPGIKRGNFTKEEEELIIQLHSQIGNKWSSIAAKLPGRTDHEIKNFWYNTQVKKRSSKRNEQKSTIPNDSNHDQESQIITNPENEMDFLGHEVDLSVKSPEISSQSTVGDFFCNRTINEVNSWDFMNWNDILNLADAADQSLNSFVPSEPIRSESDFLQPQIQEIGEVSSWDSSFSTGSNWIEEDHGLISSGWVAESDLRENFWNGSFVTDAYDHQSDNVGDLSVPQLEEGGYYDPSFQYFDYGMNLF